MLLIVCINQFVTYSLTYWQIYKVLWLSLTFPGQFYFSRACSRKNPVVWLYACVSICYTELLNLNLVACILIHPVSMCKQWNDRIRHWLLREWPFKYKAPRFGGFLLIIAHHFPVIADSAVEFSRLFSSGQVLKLDSRVVGKSTILYKSLL